MADLMVYIFFTIVTLIIWALSIAQYRLTGIYSITYKVVDLMFLGFHILTWFLYLKVGY